jgi:hypothetical protein
MQFQRVPLYAPPPEEAAFRANVQPNRVPEEAPPPLDDAKLCVIVQFVKTAW